MPTPGGTGKYVVLHMPMSRLEAVLYLALSPCEQAITWGKLHEQFGAEYEQRRNFVQKVKRELKKIGAF